MTLALVQAARSLLTAEVGEASTAAEVAARVERACEKLEGHLAQVVGREGVRALFDRTIALGTREIPTLSLHAAAPADRPWRTLSSHITAQPPRVARQTAHRVITILISLLARFIGQRLTLQMLEEVWPSIGGEDGAMQ